MAIAQLGKIVFGKIISGIRKISTKETLRSNLAKEISKLASAANKRLKRLESNNYTNLQVYKNVIETGGKFSVKGKNIDQLENELKRIQNFMNAQTSTIKGANQVLKDMAKNFNLDYNNISELKEKSDKFFELYEKVKEYDQQIGNNMSIINYHTVIDAVSKYINSNKSEYQDIDTAINEIMQKIDYELLNASSSNPSDITDGEYFLM